MIIQADLVGKLMIIRYFRCLRSPLVGKFRELSILDAT